MIPCSCSELLWCIPLHLSFKSKFCFVLNVGSCVACLMKRNLLWDNPLLVQQTPLGHSSSFVLQEQNFPCALRGFLYCLPNEKEFALNRVPIRRSPPRGARERGRQVVILVRYLPCLSLPCPWVVGAWLMELPCCTSLPPSPIIVIGLVLTYLQCELDDFPACVVKSFGAILFIRASRVKFAFKFLWCIALHSFFKCKFCLVLRMGFIKFGITYRMCLVISRSFNSGATKIACPTAGEARKWMEAFDQAKQQAEYELSRDGSVRNKLNMETEINLEGHRPRVRRYAHGLRRLIRIGEGKGGGVEGSVGDGLTWMLVAPMVMKSMDYFPSKGANIGFYGGYGSDMDSYVGCICPIAACPETLLRQTSNLSMNVGSDGCMHGDVTDVIGAHQWQCVRMENGIRMFEDVANSKSGKTVLVKAVGVVDASADTVFEVVLNVDRHQRCEWDMLTGYLELVDSVNGHYDVVYSTYDNRQLKRKSKLMLHMSFVFVDIYLMTCPRNYFIFLIVMRYLESFIHLES
ncbi:hypothetical protein TEA_021177 [Camellia sinensis var. sinensis]|uniref:START domain-containing protein n=1 Tax=Camellia sinensis var. sinensis TaxID=542762 RepID=A0A4S4DHU5_CAMSN|nr:hypothetical protein TEA_021177 [Camellia sinensis var. sinensis]